MKFYLNLFLSSLILIFSVSHSFSQSSEIGLLLGTASYKGELNQSLFNPQFIKPAVGIFYRKNMNNHWAHRLGFNYGSIVADDAASNDEYQQRRNLSFRSSIIDFHYYLEFNFFPYQIANPKSRFSPFLLVGLNGFIFNPQAELNGEWVNLQPLGTEGQGTGRYSDRKKYNRFQVSIPFGGGVKFKISRRFGMSIEAAARRTYTDYLDDVSTTYADRAVLLAENGELSAILSDRSNDGQAIGNTDRQRGNAADRDWYMFTGITLNYSISKRYNDNCSPFKGKLR